VRPVSLTVDGFTCFKERQGPIDFSGLEVFAITGVTGAGKSSLLDAIVYALYGKVPRVGKGYAECISLGRDRVSVTLDFQVRKRPYRVTRTGRRGRTQPQAMLEALDGESATPISDGVRAVDAEIERLIGLTYEAFVQAVVLPQGEFAKFLRSKRGERNAILRQILRLQVFERMRKLGGERKRELDVRAQSLRERLDKEYAGTTPEAVGVLDDELRQAEGDHARVAAERHDADVALTAVSAAHERTLELRAKRRELERLIAREPEMQDVERRLDDARRAAPVMVVLGHADSAVQRAAEAERRRAAAATQLGRVREAHGTALDRLDRARAEAARLPEIEARIRRLDEISGVAEARAAAAARRDRAQARLDGATREHASATDALDAAARRHEALVAEQAAAEQALAAVGYDPTPHERLAAERDAALALVGLRADAATAATHAATAAARAAESHQAALDTETKVAAARSTHTQALAAVEEARRAHLAATHRHAASGLRAALAVGDDCPVCTQPVRVVPPSLDAPEVDASKRRIDECGAAEQRAAAAAREAETVAAKARAAADQQTDAATHARAEADERAEHLQAAAARLQASAGSVVPGPAATPIEQRVRSALETFASLRTRWEQAKAARDRLDAETVGAGHALESTRERARVLADAVAAATRTLAETTHEIAALDRRIAEVTSEADPRIERDALAAELKRIDDERRSAESGEADRRAELSAAEASLTQASTAATADAQASTAASAQAERATRDAGFASSDALRAAALPPDDERRLAGVFSEHRTARLAHETRVRELTTTLAGGEIDDQQLAEARARASELRSAQETLARDTATLTQRLSDLRKKVADAADLATTLDGLETRRALHARLAQDLRTDGFETFLLDEVFAELLSGASVRLWALSGRYTFDYHDDGFHVLDHDNARERRSAETLSGGETFLASLALALELSAQVQRAAGAVVLESIFIDEGFGTLDPETLETVAQAIETLPVDGRMVGIISHVPELTARLPARLEVQKGPDGARVVRVE